MLRVNKTRLLVEHESCKCKNGMDESECNSKQKQNHIEYQCQYKELDYWSSHKNNYM